MAGAVVTHEKFAIISECLTTLCEFYDDDDDFLQTRSDVALIAMILRFM